MEGRAAIPEVPRTVSRFEAHLLRLLRSFLRPGETLPAAPAAAGGRLALPPGLSPECLHLVRDTLRKGIVVCLARAGGWRRERHLRDGRPVEGRLWDRSPAVDLGLSFSKHTISFLMWLTAGRPEKPNDWDAPVAELTTGDLLLLFLAYEALREREAGAALRVKPQFARHGLVRLFFPEDFASNAAPLDYAPWAEGSGSAIIEALQPRLRERWLEQERAKGVMVQWDALRGVGQSQEHTLAAFLDACEKAKRPDLARFALQAMNELLSRDLTPAFWTGGLLTENAPTRLAERLATQRQALAVVAKLERLAGWTQGFAGTQFFDEDYATAQLWLLNWEQNRGDELTAIAQNLLRQLEPLAA
jgi:hypothetical protein